MVLGVLLHALQRQEQEPEQLVRVHGLVALGHRLIEIDLRMFPFDEFLEFARTGPLDRLAGDRTLEDVMRLVLGIDCQLEVERVVNVDVGEDAALAVLLDLLPFDVVLQPLFFQRVT